MPLTFSTEVQINASPERVFAAMIDVDRWKSWMDGLVKVEKLTPGAFGAGTEWRETRKLFGKQATEQFEVTAFDSPRKMSLRIDGRKGSSGKGEYL